MKMLKNLTKMKPHLSAVPPMSTARPPMRSSVFLMFRPPVGWTGSYSRPSVMPPRYSRSASDPLLAAFVELLLPERDRLLQCVDRLTAGVERGRAVRGGDRDHDARLADLYAADAVVDRDPAEPVPRGQVVRERA